MAHYDIVQVKLSDIENIRKNDLEQTKLDALENSYDSFEDQLNSKFNPIALDKGKSPYGVTDGRHRVFLARQKGYKSVPATFI
jgi:hypothetical protein